jgi:hypothetical protein
VAGGRRRVGNREKQIQDPPKWNIQHTPLIHEIVKAIFKDLAAVWMAVALQRIPVGKDEWKLTARFTDTSEGQLVDWGYGVGRISK